MPVTAIAKQSSASGTGSGTGPKVPFKKMFSSSHLMNHSGASPRHSPVSSNAPPASGMSGVTAATSRGTPLVSLSHQLSQSEALSSSLPDVAITSGNRQLHSANDSRSSQRSALSSTSRTSGEASGSLSVISSNAPSLTGSGSFTSGGGGTGRRPSRAILAATALEPSMIVTLSNYLGTLRKFEHDKLAKEIGLMLNYFEDVVVKDKLELLPGACTIILETLDRNCALLRATYQQLQQVQLRLQLLHNADDTSHDESTGGKNTVIESTNKLYNRMSELLQWSDRVSTTDILLPSETSDDPSGAKKTPTKEAEKVSNVAQARVVSKNLLDAFNDLIVSYRTMESDFRQSFEECLHANKQIVDMILAESNSVKQLSNIRRRSITPPPDYNRKLSDRPLTNGSTSTIASSTSSNASSNSSSFLRGPHRFFPTLISTQAQKMAHHLEKKFSKNPKSSKGQSDGTPVQSGNTSGQKGTSGWSGFLPRLTGSSSNLRRAGSASEIANRFLDLPDSVCPDPNGQNQFRKLSINELSPRKIVPNRHSDGATPTSDKESPRAASGDTSPKTEMLWNPIYFDTSRFHNSPPAPQHSDSTNPKPETASDGEKPPPLPPKTYRTSGRSSITSNASMNSSSGSSLTQCNPAEIVKLTTPPNSTSCSLCKPIAPVCKCQSQFTQSFGDKSPEFPNVTLRRKPSAPSVPEVITTCCCGDPSRHQTGRQVSPPPLPPPDLFPPQHLEIDNSSLSVKNSTSFQSQTSVIRTYRRETYHTRAHRSYSIAAESILVSPTMDSLQVIGRTIPTSNSFHSRLAHSKSMFGGTPPPLPPKRRNMAEYMVMVGNYGATTPGNTDFTHFYSTKARLDPRSPVVMSASMGSISSSESSTSSSFCARQSTYDPLNDQQQYDHLPIAPPPPTIAESIAETEAPQLPPRKEAKKVEPPPARPQKTIGMVEPRSITPPEIKQALICDCVRVVPREVDDSADEAAEVQIFVGGNDSLDDSIMPTAPGESGIVIEEPEPEIQSGCPYCSEHGDHAEDDCILAQIDVPSSALEFRGQKSATHGEESTEDDDGDLGDLTVVAGTVDALVIRAAQSNPQGDEKTFYWTFLLTYRTILSPELLIEKLIFRYRKLSETTKQRTDIVRQALASKVVAFILTIVDSFYIYDLSPSLSTRLMDFIYQLVGRGDLGHAKELREKCYKIRHREREIGALTGVDNSLRTHNIKMRSATLLDFKSEHLAEQMTFLDARLFHKIEVSELLIWARDQREDLIPHLSCFTEHFNKMSFWTRSLILDHEDPKERERYAMKFLKIMKHLRKLNNFNSYLAILSALGSAPVSRLDWPKNIEDTVNDYQSLIDSSSSFRTYRTVLAMTKPPCIPYIGLILQDLTFIHIGNPDMRRDGLVNFPKQYKQFTILQQMQRFKDSQYSITENEVITGFFDNFDQYHPEEVLWQLSESIRPRGGGVNSSSSISQAS